MRVLDTDHLVEFDVGPTRATYCVTAWETLTTISIWPEQRGQISGYEFVHSLDEHGNSIPLPAIPLPLLGSNWPP